MEKSTDCPSAFTSLNGRGLSGIKDHDCCQYQIAVWLPAALRQMLEAEQAYAVSRFGAGVMKDVATPLLLASFEAREDMEDTLLRWLQRITGQQESFMIQFNNYGSKPDCSLYVRLQDPRQLRKLAESFRVLDNLIQSDQGGGLLLQYHPRIPMAESLDPAQEMAVLLDFSGRNFSAAMQVEELVLMRTDRSTGKTVLVSRLALAPKGLHRQPISNDLEETI
jgi:hypothetical protein